MLGGEQSFETKEEFFEYAKKKMRVLKKLPVAKLNQFIKINGYYIVRNNGVVSLEPDGTEQSTEATAVSTESESKDSSLDSV